ncbi:MAG: proteasome assembly chaperone family protein [Candidatus Hydrothermarchaeota archaeon]
METKVVEVAEFYVKEPTVVEGFPGVGLVGSIAAYHIINELNMEYVAYVKSPHFAPIAVLEKGIVRPPVRIYASEDLFILYSDIFIPPQAVFDTSSSIVDWISQYNPKLVVTLAGIAAGRKEERNVFGVAGTSDSLEILKKTNIPLMERGGITGISGQILLDCYNKNLFSVCILSETEGVAPDPRSAAEMVKALNRLLGLEIRTEPLLEEAEKFEEYMHNLSQQMKTAEERERPPSVMYL